MSPLLLWALALTCAALGLRERRARTRPAGRTGGGVPAVVGVAARLVPPGAVAGLEREGDTARIARAGLEGVVAPLTLARARVGGGAAGVVAGLVAGAAVPVAVVLVVPAAALGVLLPGRALAGRERARRRAVVRELPDLLDLLGICVEAGMALDPALELASGRLGGVLGDEIARVLRDLSLGTPRARAYRDLTARVGAPEMARTVGALLQAEELGAPLSRALEGQAEALRAARRQDARERAARAAPKIQLVVAMVMVPAVLLLVIGVLLMEMARQVGGVVG